MDRVAAANYVTVGGKRKFADKNLGTNTPGTSLGEQWFNAVQEMLMLTAEAFGIAATHADDTQLLTALRLAAGNNQRSVSANTTLTVADAGMVSVSAAGGNVTLTLPAANAAGGKPFPIIVLRTDTSANTVTVSRAGSDVIWPGAQTSIGVGALSFLILRSDGVSVWHPLTRPAQGTQVFTSSGTFTVPAGVSEVEVEVWGGGGGSSASSGAGVYTNGGGGGGYSRKIVAGLAPGGTVTVTIGAGGSATSSGVTGGAGGTSSFGSHCSATGGAGAATAVGYGALAGSGSGGDVNLSGGQGAGAIPGVNAGNGGDGAQGGAGGWGGQSTSNPGMLPGGGAGGAGAGSAGSPGAPGLVVVRWG